jgi:hypothetical protein
MPVALLVPRVFKAIAIASTCVWAAGCSLLANDFAPRTVGTTAANTAPGAASTIEAKPAVLVQEGTVATGATPAPSSLALVPKDNAASTSKLSPEEKARVIAELEALARGETPAAAVKPECAAAAAKPGVTAAALPAGCATAPKPAARP